jgi:hypothetical protein
VITKLLLYTNLLGEITAPNEYKQEHFVKKHFKSYYIHAYAGLGFIEVFDAQYSIIGF